VTIEELLAQGSIAAIGAAYRARQLSVAEAIDWYLARIERLNHAGPNLNAVRELNPRARGDARAADEDLANGRDRGPLHGIAVLIKDNILVAGMTATAGASALVGFAPRADAPLVRRLRQAGAVVLGKTNMTEFADYVSDVMPSEFSSAGGVVRNPHGIVYERGQGSSVGSAAAVAAGLATFAIGSETQNSIQTPASYSSVFGFKPTVGNVSRSGIIPLVPSQDSPGPMTRSAADAMLVLDAIAAPDALDPISLLPERRSRDAARIDTLAGVRIGVPRRAQADRPDFAAMLPLFERVLTQLSQAGASIVDPCDLPTAEQLLDVRSCVFRAEFKAALDAFLEQHGAPGGMRSMADIIAWNAGHPDKIPYGQPLLIAANETPLDDRYVRDRARDIALARTGGIDPALALGGVDVLIAPMGAAAKCSGKAGTPVAAVPAGLDPGGVPFGITLFAGMGQDRRLLAIAGAVEEVIGQRVVVGL
jgi:amidase